MSLLRPTLTALALVLVGTAAAEAQRVPASVWSRVDSRWESRDDRDSDWDSDSDRRRSSARNRARSSSSARFSSVSIAPPAPDLSGLSAPGDLPTGSGSMDASRRGSSSRRRLRTKVRCPPSSSPTTRCASWLHPWESKAGRYRSWQRRTTDAPVRSRYRIE